MSVSDSRDHHGSEAGSTANDGPDDTGEAATLRLSGDPPGSSAEAVPGVDGLVDAVEQARVFEALFEVPAPRMRMGRFVVLDTLGQGGMGTVFEAFDRTLDRRVALKVLHHDLDQRYATRLLREAQALAKLSHPNVVHVYEVGEAEGRTFIAMELVRGQTLHAWVRQRPRPAWRECVRVYLQAGDGLAAAHARGLVHRDFKPGNVVIDDDGRVRVLDFGLARGIGQPPARERSETSTARSDLHPEESALDVPLTRTGAVLGTPAYMPVEQMKGLEADARSDQFSFCASLYEAIYGERPFEGATMTARMVSMMGEVRPAPRGTKVPVALRSALVRGLASDPQARWPSMEALLAELRAMVAPRLRRIVGVAAGVGVILLGGAGAALMRQSDELSAMDEQLTGKEALLAERVAQLEQKDRRLTGQLATQKGLRAMMMAEEAGHELAATRLAVEAFEGLDPRASTLPEGVFEGLTQALTTVHRGVAMRGHVGEVVGVAFSPDGRRMATASWDSTARLWDTSTSAPLRALEGHEQGVTAVAWSPGGDLVATASFDGTVRTWDATTGEPLDAMEHGSPVWDVAFSPRGHALASASETTAWVWHLGADAIVVPVVGHADIVRGVAFSPDGTRLLTASEDRTARVWDAHTGSEQLTLRGHRGAVLGVACSPDGTRIATASEDHTVRLWGATTAQVLASLPHDDAVHAVAWSPDGTQLATASWDGEAAHLWDVATGRRLSSWRHVGPVVDVAFSPHGRHLASASWDHTARSWNLRSGGGIVPLQGHTGRIDAVAVSPEGDRVVTGGNTVRVWDPRSGALRATLRGHATGVQAVALAPDGARIASASWDGVVRLWDADSATLLRSFEGHVGPVRSVTFSPDGAHVVTAGRDRSVRWWDAATGRALHTWWHDAPLVDAIVTPEGRRVVGVGADRAIRVWGVATEDEVGGFADQGPVTAVAMSADGSRVASATDGSMVRVWDAATGEEYGALQGHTAPIVAMAFSADGERLATASDDGTARVWELAAGKSLAVFPHEATVGSVALTPDGTWLATASGERDARLWSLDPQVWLGWGCVVLDQRAAHSQASLRACAGRRSLATAPVGLAENPVDLEERVADVDQSPPRTVMVRGVEYVFVPGGTFTMGAPPEEVGRDNDDERPMHEVTVNGFYMARTELTNAQYARFLEANPEVAVPALWDSLYYRQPDQPVVAVSWYDAQAYCEWAGVELPTEAQWEYAARAGATTAYWFGGDARDLERFGWYEDNAGRRTHHVGTLDPNPWGLYDLNGNVWEWCADAYAPYVTGAPLESGDDPLRVIRGGGWGYEARYARSARRLSREPSSSNASTGLRPVLAARDREP